MLVRYAKVEMVLKVKIKLTIFNQTISKQLIFLLQIIYYFISKWFYK